MHGDITKKTKCWLVLPLFLNFLQSTYFLYACSRNSPPPNTQLEILLLSFIEYPLCLRNLVESQFSSVTQSCPTLCDPMDCSMPGFPVLHCLLKFLKFMSTEFVVLSNHLILCHPLLFLPSIFPSIRVFSNESVLRIRWPQFWSFSFSISPSSEYSGLGRVIS